MAWEHEVVAFNTATGSTNRMHDDAVAATFGFRGGLVPGVDVWAYLTRPCVDRWGTGFLEGGAMEARFLVPVYDGERVVCRLDDDGTLTATGPDGTVRARGLASIADPPPVADLGVTDEREHKGHRFVDLDVEITADGQPAWSAQHTAIWRPRQDRA
jgi:hypothetical protein